MTLLVEIDIEEGLMVARVPVPGFAGLFVDNRGRVWSRRRNWGKAGSIRLLTQSTDREGYPSVYLKGYGKMWIHRLIARAFLGPKPSGKREVRHLDGNKENNSPWNLAWGTAKENAQDRILHGRTLCGSRHHQAKLTEDDIREIRRLRGEGVSRNAIAKKYSLHPGTIASIVARRAWRHVQ